VNLTFFEMRLNDFLDAVDPVVSESVNGPLDVTVVFSLILFEANGLFFLFCHFEKLGFHRFLAFGLDLFEGDYHTFL
jgi:hypothetical protein